MARHARHAQLLGDTPGQLVNLFPRRIKIYVVDDEFRSHRFIVERTYLYTGFDEDQSTAGKDIRTLPYLPPAASDTVRKSPRLWTYTLQTNNDAMLVCTIELLGMGMHSNLPCTRSLQSDSV